MGEVLGMWGRGPFYASAQATGKSAQASDTNSARLTHVLYRHTIYMSIYGHETAAVMQKIQVFLREDQKAALKSISNRTGQKQSDLIRRSVDLLIDRMKRENIDWREATRSAAGLWKDRMDLEDISQELRDAAKRRFSSVYKPG